MIEVEFVKLREAARVPTQAYEGDAGWDLYVDQDTEIPIGKPTDVRTGIAVAIPEGYYGRIVHRSSSPRKKGIMVLEGIIDSGFRGELFACAFAWAPQLDPQGFEHRGPLVAKQGESIAQLIIQHVEPATLRQVEELQESERGEKGFGSSGN